MGLFGGSSSKSTATASETGQQVEDSGLAINVAGSRFAKNSSLVVNQTDLGSVDSAFDFADGALVLAGDSTRNALEFGAGAFQSAIDSANDSRSESLEFGAGAFTSALDFADKAAARGDAAQRAATKAAQESSRDALEFGAGAFQSTLASVDSATDDAISAAAAAYNSSAGQVSHFAQTAIDKVADSTRSEASKSFDLLVKLFAGVVGVGVVAYVLRAS